MYGIDYPMHSRKSLYCTCKYFCLRCVYYVAFYSGKYSLVQTFTGVHFKPSLLRDYAHSHISTILAQSTPSVHVAFEMFVFMAVHLPTRTESLHL